jgi:hypothetical protein
MHYLVQENLFTERNYYLILDYIKKIGGTYDIVSIIPFTDDIKKRVDDEFAEFDTDHKKTLSEMRGFLSNVLFMPDFVTV